MSTLWVSVVAARKSTEIRHKSLVMLAVIRDPSNRLIIDLILISRTKCYLIICRFCGMSLNRVIGTVSGPII